MMNSLFYDAAVPISRVSATGACAGMNVNTLNLNAAGMLNCSVTLSCSSESVSTDQASFVSIVSHAECGTGSTLARRSVEVSAYIE